jgi:hypothetical protein
MAGGGGGDTTNANAMGDTTEGQKRGTREDIHLPPHHRIPPRERERERGSGERGGKEEGKEKKNVPQSPT